MAKIMNVTLLDFFNHTLKNNQEINLDVYKKEFPEVDIIYSNTNN